MKGLICNVRAPLAQGGAALFNLVDTLTSYSHIHQANGGFWSATAGLTEGRAAVEDWFQNGLMRDIRVYTASGVCVFRGFVNKVEIGLGALSATRGPVLDMANKVALGYSTIDTSVSPPLMGVRAYTAWSSDAFSQARYGVLENVLSTGGVTADNAAAIVATFLQERRLPRTSETLNLQAGTGALSVRLEILGYIHLLKKFTFFDLSTGTGKIATKLAAVIAAEPNGWFGAPSLADNSQEVALWEDEFRTAWTVVWEMVEKGDPSGTRYLLGMYGENNQIVYAPMTTQVAYHHRLSSQSANLTTPGGRPLDPLTIRAGQWLFIPDFLPGATPAFADPLQDPRMVFLESVTYTAPEGLQIQGGNISRVQNLLNSLGLSGIGA